MVCLQTNFILTGVVSNDTISNVSPEQVLKLRKSLKLTQQQLADLIGAQRHTVARWETGVNAPRGANLKQLRELEAKAKKMKRAAR